MLCFVVPTLSLDLVLLFFFVAIRTGVNIPSGNLDRLELSYNMTQKENASKADSLD